MEAENIIKKYQNKYILLTDWNKYFDYPKISTLRSYVFNASSNGFRKCMKRENRRIQIDVEEYFKWKEERDKLYDLL